MGQTGVVRAIGLTLGLAATLSAQSNLNRTPAREVGHPQLPLYTKSPNLVEGREFYEPRGIAVDTSANPPVLYVGDFFNNRILVWKNASAFANGAKADFVVGQKDFYTTAVGGPGQPFASGLYLPSGLAVDKSGNLYVVDTGNNRILRFPKPYAQAEQFPDLVIGQISLSCAACRNPNSGVASGASARTINIFNGNGPYVAGIVFDSQGNLWFTDSANNRVLRYPASALGAGAPNGPAADLVLGQTDFVTNTLPQQQQEALVQNKSVLNQPTGLAFDPAGRLFVSDSYDRVLVFQPNLSPQTFDNGRAALRLMGFAPQRPGQPVPKPNQYQFSNPTSVFMVGSSPGIVDLGNHRLLLFDPYGDPSWPADTTLSPPAKASGPVGQAASTFAKPNRGLPEPRNNTFSAPVFAVTVGSELFVADSGNNRVLVFPTSGLGPNSIATRVLGQDDFVFRAPNLIEGRELNFSPALSGSDGGLMIDLVSDVPHLFIADTYNHRVLGYRDVRTVRPGDKADLVIGQPDFQRAVINYPSNDPDKPNNQGLYLPVGLAIDSSGNLFVADTGNGRVLRFPKPFDQAQQNFPSADLLLGQGSYTSTVKDPTQRTMRAPYSLAFTSDGALLVSDSALNRVLLFGGKGQAFSDGMSANKLFGQPDFFSFSSGTDTNQMNSPKHIATDSDDRLYVADESNNRILIFDNVGFASSGATNARAGTVVTTSTPNNGLYGVRALFVSKITGEFWVSEANSNRLLRYPKFDDLIFQQNTSNYQILINPGIASVALAQDGFGDLYVAETSNRVSIYYPGLTATNGANYIIGRALSPGAIVTLNRQGTDFTATDATADPANWPTELADTQVLVNDSPAPIKSVQRDQISFQMPMSAPAGGTVEVQVVRKSTGQILGAGQVDMAPVSPALFTRGPSGTGIGQVVAVNDDGTVNEPFGSLAGGHPIGRGKVVSLFGTGQGYIDGAPPDGQAPTGKVATPTLPRVFVGTRFVDDADIVYSGLAPGQVGVWQIDVKIPDFVAPSCTVPVIVQVRSISSSLPSQLPTIAVSQDSGGACGGR